MSKAGPLTRSTSNRANPAEAVVGSYDETAPSLSSSANTRRPPRLGECGRRLRSDEIGLALGSPRQDKLSQLPPDDRDVDVFHVCSSPDNQSNLPGGTGEIRDDSRRIKRKGSKWRSCGSFFGRKDSFARGQEPPPFYQLDQAHNRQEQTEQRVAQVQRRKLRDSYYTNQVQQTKLSESIFREKNNGFLGRNSSRRRGLRRREMGDFKPDMQQSPPTFSAQAAASANIQPSLTNDLQKRGEPRPRPFGPLLQVEIPCVELERYSIMFGDLLDPKTQPTISSQPSLLARRQLHLQDLQDRVCLLTTREWITGLLTLNSPSTSNFQHPTGGKSQLPLQSPNPHHFRSSRRLLLYRPEAL